MCQNVEDEEMVLWRADRVRLSFSILLDDDVQGSTGKVEGFKLVTASVIN